MNERGRMGHYARAKGAANRLKIYEFIQKNPDALVREVADALGLSRQAAGAHIWAIRDGWKPEGK